VRQIALTNQIALFGTAATVPYQVYYLATDPAYYTLILVVNLPFIAGYLSGLPLNALGRFDAARNLTLGTAFVHMVVATALISNASGVHLFYYTIASVSALIFLRRRTARLALLAALAGALFMACHLFFPPGSVPVRIPEPALRVMYAFSALSAMALTCLFSYLFRLEIDRAEEALTESNRALERLAVLDPLTGVANRRALEQQLEQEWERARRHGTEVALLVCDVDHFKAYNDRYGHVAGDACLQQVASTLEGVIRRATDLVARYGGEEFVVVLPETPLAGALRIAEDARRSVAELAIPHDAAGDAGVVTLSIGVACGGPGSAASPDELLKRADVALYEAKRQGRNTVQAADLAGSAVAGG